MKVRFTQSARKHHVGHAHAMYVIRSGPPIVVPPGDPTLDERWVWIADDVRGVELEVIAVLTTQYLLVIHVMPTALRRKP